MKMNTIKRINKLLSAIDLRDKQVKIMIISADELEHRHHPPFPPDVPVVIYDVQSKVQLHLIIDQLGRIYDSNQELQVLIEYVNEEIVKIPFRLVDVTSSEKIAFPANVYIPVGRIGDSYEAFEEIVAHLRAPDGCPWDREQTHASLRPHLLEETYEVLEAMDNNDSASLKEELGDLLLQIILNAQIATEEKEFRMTDVLDGIYSKIVRRHPHVFGDANINEVDGVLKNWERLKETERKANGTAESKGLLDGVPHSLPALAQAEEYQDRATRVGFDWKTIEPVIAKMYEEFDEVKNAANEPEQAKELGDLLFAVVNVIRWYKVDAESALRGANQRFVARFKYIEEAAKKAGKNLSDLSFEEMDSLWDEAKKKKI
jgi:tetrapyrrole methylase family protein/MazG family protein